MQSSVAQPDPDELAQAAQTMLRAGRPAAARPLLAALSRLKPDAEGLALLECDLREAEGCIPGAIAVLDAELAGRPADAVLLKRRAGLRHRSGDGLASIDDAAAAVIAAPHDAAAKALLGVLLLTRGDAAAARACLSEASEAEPDNGDFRLGLAEAMERCGEARLAAALLEEGISLSPARTDLREATIRLALRRKDPQAAERLAIATREAGLANATILCLLAQAAAAQGRATDQTHWLAEALKLSPADESLRHLAAAAGIVPAAERAPADFVRREFERQAGTFVPTTIETGNRVPGLIRSAVLAHARGRRGPTLDLGCGTGLAAVALSDFSLEPFIGVDLSRAMLAAARGWGLYAELAQADLVDFLAAEQRCFALILAADVLPWFGSLAPVLAAVRSRLAPGGRFILSLDTAPAEDVGKRAWVLGPKGRYAHSVAGFESTARDAGFEIIATTPEILRSEDGAAIEGMITVAGLRGDAE
ncbi:MAG: methyltransferase domain-containing protein [Acetobacteraceae bacterium]